MVQFASKSLYLNECVCVCVCWGRGCERSGCNSLYEYENRNHLLTTLVRICKYPWLVSLLLTFLIKLLPRPNRLLMGYKHNHTIRVCMCVRVCVLFNTSKSAKILTVLQLFGPKQRKNAVEALHKFVMEKSMYEDMYVCMNVEFFCRHFPLAANNINHLLPLQFCVLALLAA